MGYAAARGALELPSALLYLGGIAWTLGYDTIYAHQDKEDDARIGIKSSARRLGDQSKPWIAGFYMMTIILYATVGLSPAWAGRSGSPWRWPPAISPGRSAPSISTVRTAVWRCSRPIPGSAGSCSPG